MLFELVGALPRHPDPAQREAGAVLLHDAFGLLGLGPLLERVPEAEQTAVLAADLGARLAARLGEAVHLNGQPPAAAIQAVIAARAAARTAKDFALGDRLRDALAAEGIVLKDSKDGTTWTVAGS